MADLNDENRTQGTTRIEAAGDDEIVIHLEGEFDLSNAEGLESVLTSVDDTLRATFDAGALEFIDSSGLAVLLRFVARHGPIEVRHAPPMFRRIVEVSGLGDQIRISESE